MMEFLLIVAVAGALAWLWRRMNALERRVAELEADAAPRTRPAISARLQEHDGATSRPPPAPAPQPEALAPRASPPTAGRPLPPEHELPLPAALPPKPGRAEAGRDVLGRALRLRPTFDFEEIFGRLLPIWGGGVALAIAGFFLVRWSIEVGMLTQSVRVGLGFAFGALLVGAAELAHRFEHRISDVRVRQALAGAGLATLYASFYLAGSHYGLIGPVAAFAGLAGVTLVAILLSFRFGLPSAVLGLVGGFAAPALAGSTDPNLPLLATYLALVTGGLTVTGERQQRSWLGLAALAVALGWGATMLLAGEPAEGGVVAIGVYLVLVGTLLPSMMGQGPLGRIGRIAAAALATVQIAALVDRTGYSLLAWGCYLLLGTALAVLGARFVRLREASAIAAALLACLLAVWPDAPGFWFAAIAAASALIFAAVPLVHVWRGRAGRVDWGQVALFPIALIAAACVQLGVPVLEGRSAVLAMGALVLASLPGAAAWHACPERGAGLAPAALASLAASFVLAMLAGLLALPAWSAPLVTAVLALAAALVLRGRSLGRARALPWGVALSGLVLLAATASFEEVERLFTGSPVPDWLSATRWLAAALPFGLLLIDEAETRARRLGEIAAALLGYGAMAMLLPGAWLPLAIALAVLGLAWRAKHRVAALGTLLVIGALWAAEPLIHWSAGGVAALAGDPFLLGDLPSLGDVARFVAPLALALAGAVLLGADGSGRQRRAAGVGAIALLAIVAHVAFKQAFALADMARFAELGLAERTVWQALLALAGLGFAALPQQRLAGAGAAAGRALAAIALGHFTWFSLALHNPLWAEQAVGPWPIANWLLPSYGAAIGLTLWLRAGLAAQAVRLRPVFDAAIMVLIALLALSQLRQLFSGSVLTGPVGAREDLLRSMLAIAVALGFLGWGARSGQRSWRVGSLVLMLLAVLKVFILDAAGLEGLARIASFLALGICLIGIGWFYSRQLGVRPTGAGDRQGSGTAPPASPA